jgi:uncharacterized protein YjiS (DUF1127 family)
MTYLQKKVFDVVKTTRFYIAIQCSSFELSLKLQILLKATIMTYCTDIDIQAKPTISLFAWIVDFFQKRGKRRQAVDDLYRLDDRELCDIGIRRRDIAAIVDREIGKLRLDEFRSRL